MSALDDAAQAGAECRTAAIQYCRLGWSSLAVCPPDHACVSNTHAKKCNSPGKAPVGLWKEYQDRLPTEEELLAKWSANPFLNVGMALGPVSGLVRVDIDGEAGEAHFLSLCGGEIIETLEFTSGNGRGLLLAIPEGVQIKTTVKPIALHEEIRFQAKGAQTVLPPSRHHTGRRYRWREGHGPGEIRAALMSHWMVELVKVRPKVQPEAAHSGGGNRTVFSGRATNSNVMHRVRAYLGKCPPAIQGLDGSKQLMKTLRLVIDGFALDDAQAREIAEEYSAKCVPPWSAEEITHALDSIKQRPSEKPRGSKLNERNGTVSYCKLNGEAGHAETHPERSDEAFDDVTQPTPPGEPEPEFSEPESQQNGSNEAVDDPDRLARLYLSLKCQNDREERILRYCRENYLKHDAGVYREITTDEFRADIHNVVKPEFDRMNEFAIREWAAEEKGPKPKTNKVTRGLITNIEEAIRAKVILPSDVNPPYWIGGSDGRPTNLLALANGFLDLDAFFAGRQALRPHSAEWFSTTIFPYDFNPSATCPKWLAILQRNLERDAERIAVLQEWFGLNAVHDTTLHKFLALEGEGSNGKGVICAALRGMLGNNNHSSVALELFAERFQLTPTYGKLANIVSECGELDKVAEGFFKSFV